MGLIGENQMGDFSTALLSGLGSGLVVACADYLFTRKQMEARDRKEFESYRCQRIEDLVSRFEYVRINYQRMHLGGDYDEGFLMGHETIPLTFIERDLRLWGSLLSHPFNDLMHKQFEIACKLALEIGKDQSRWNALIAEWNLVSEEISNAMATDFYSKRITSPSSRS